MTAFQLGSKCTTAFVSPLIEFPENEGQGYQLNFWSHTGYANGAKLVTKLLDRNGNVVQVLDEFIKESHPDWAPFWDEHILYLPDTTEPGYICFEYIGNDDNTQGPIMTTTYEIDDIVIEPANAELELTASVSSYDFYSRAINEDHTYTITFLGRNLPEDIQLSLVDSSQVFTLSTTTLPKEGGDITISFDAKKSESFTTKILVKSGEASLAIPVLATVEGNEDDDNDDDDEPTQGSYHFDTTATPISLNEDFESGTLPEGWSSQALVGTRQWIIKEYNSNQYAQFSAFKSGEQLTVGLITPLVAIDAAKEYELQFDLKSGFCNGAPLKVCLYDAQGHLTKELKTFTATESEQGYADNFTTETIVLPKGISNSFILFEYEGDDSSQSKRTTTYQVDNVQVSQITALQDVVTASAYTIDGVKLILTGHSSLTLYTVDGTMVAHGDYPATSQITLEPSRCYMLLLNGITYKVMTRE